MLTSQKSDLRRKIKLKLSGLTSAEKKSQSDEICTRLLPLLTNATTLCAFVPLSDEPDIRPILEQLLKRQTPLFLPRYQSSEVTFHRITSIDALIPGNLGVPEPSAGAPQPDPASISLVLVPGRAFDRAGNRLGRGKGGYDRWIDLQRKANPSTRFVGVAFREQLVDSVPTEHHDQRMDTVVVSGDNDQPPSTNDQTSRE